MKEMNTVFFLNFSKNIHIFMMIVGELFFDCLKEKDKKITLKNDKKNS